VALAELVKITVLNASGGQRGLAPLESQVLQREALGCPAGTAATGEFYERLSGFIFDIQ
jgi:hypothetical protein